jgi:ankyrin repeat protein
MRHLLRSLAIITVALICLGLVFGSSNMARRRQELLVHGASKGSVSPMRLLIALGADPKSNKSGGYPLYYAAWANQPKAAELLISKGASVDSREPSGWTPIMAAASRGNDAVVRVLVNHKASLTMVAACGNALDMAIANHHETTIAILEAAGAVPYIKAQ